VQFLGHRFRTDPGVFHPVHFSSSRILATCLTERSLRGLRVLDMGTGAGPIAVAAAAHGALVTACDVNPRAVALARENVARNGYEVEVIESDLFGALAGRRFDLICFNVPFFARDPTTLLDAAFDAGRHLETIHRFARECVHHLESNGRVAIIVSEDGDCAAIFEAFAGAGLVLERRRVGRKFLERFYVAWFRA